MNDLDSRKLLSRYFLSWSGEYSFITQKKVYVLLWTHLMLVPVMSGLMAINILRGPFPFRMAMIAIDIFFISTMVLGLVLLYQGRYSLVVNIDIIIATSISFLGTLIKEPVVVKTGCNQFTVVILATIVFTALFGTARVLGFQIISFSILNIYVYLSVYGRIAPDLLYHLQSGIIFTGIGIIIVSCLTYLINKITTDAFGKTRKELARNVELNLTLEEKVEKRTEELKEKNRDLDRLVGKLSQSLEKVKTLSGLLPICAHCKKIRDDKGYWNQLEDYISTQP